MRRWYRAPRRPRPSVVPPFRRGRLGPALPWRPDDPHATSWWRLSDARDLRLAVMRTRPWRGPLPPMVGDRVRPGVSVLRRWRGLR